MFHWEVRKMSRGTIKPSIRLERPVKTQTSLHIRAVWSYDQQRLRSACTSVFAGRMIRLHGCAGWSESLHRVFADRMCILQPPGYSKRNKWEPLPYQVDVQADLSLCWSHRSYCRFCRALAQISLICGCKKAPYLELCSKYHSLFSKGQDMDNQLHKLERSSCKRMRYFVLPMCS